VIYQKSLKSQGNRFVDFKGKLSEYTDIKLEEKENDYGRNGKVYKQMKLYFGEMDSSKKYKGVISEEQLNVLLSGEQEAVK
jgi:hypothetical protein